MNHVGKSLFAFVILTGALSTQAQVRTWAFSKDTLFDWASAGDFVDVSNTGTDTLQFDSVALQLVAPSMNRYEVLFALQSGTPAIYHLRYDAGVVSRPYGGTEKIKVGNGQTRRFQNFEVESQIPITAKRAAIGDTLTLRMIFIAAGSRGRDTLMVKGRQQYPSSLRNDQDFRATFSPSNRLFDLRGRQIERVPEGVKVPWAPVVSPRD
jgi:hypothetical protein